MATSHGAIGPNPPTWLWAVGLATLFLAFRYRRATLVLSTGGPGTQSAGRAIRRSTALERRHGSPAEAPSDGSVWSWRTWKNAVVRLYNRVIEHRIIDMAAGMTFYSLLAIFPALAALVAIYGLFADPASITAHVNSLSGFVPSGAMDVAREQLTRVAAKGRQALGLTFLIGLAVSLWSANAAMKSLFDTLNVIHDVREQRSFILLNLETLAFTLAALLFALLAIGAVVVLPVLLNYVGLSSNTDLLLRLGRWPAMLVVLTLALAFIYRFGPCRESARWRWITAGSALAAVLWLAVSLLFSWYTANFGKYNETYGSLGAVIGFMTWLWISAMVILLGAEVDADMESERRRRGSGGTAPASRWQAEA